MNNSEALNNAIAFHQSGNFQKAEQEYNKILTIDPNNFYALHYLGLLYYQQQKYALAIDFIRKALGI